MSSSCAYNLCEINASKAATKFCKCCRSLGVSMLSSLASVSFKTWRVTGMNFCSCGFLVLPSPLFSLAYRIQDKEIMHELIYTICKYTSKVVRKTEQLQHYTRNKSCNMKIYHSIQIHFTKIILK